MLKDLSNSPKKIWKRCISFQTCKQLLLCENCIKINQSVSICVPWKHSNYRFWKMTKFYFFKCSGIPLQTDFCSHFLFVFIIIWQEKTIHWNVGLKNCKDISMKNDGLLYVVHSPEIWWLWPPWFLGAVRLTNDTFTNLSQRIILAHKVKTEIS